MIGMIDVDASGDIEGISSSRIADENRIVEKVFTAKLRKKIRNLQLSKFGYHSREQLSTAILEYPQSFRSFRDNQENDSTPWRE